ncbi:glycosyltransferase family 39 protein [Candidatus Sumerlaeota bacterium]|nr:glycosyltransferase family 39 protein [Candidatus Sumerlaeota bacterium]
MSEIKFTRREGDAPESRPAEPESAAPPPREPRPRRSLPGDRGHGEIPRRAVGPIDHLLLIAIAAVLTLMVWFTMGGLGMTWDEAYYFEPHRDAVRWVHDLINGTIDPLTGHDPYWEEISELPALPRLISGFSGALFEGSWIARRNLLAPLVAQRMLTGVLLGLNCWLIACLLLRPLGLGPAIVAMLAYGTMPRVFGHAHFAATETLMTTMTLLVTASFLWGLRSWRGAIVTGVLFGLALNTKFNLALLPIPLWIWAWARHRQRCADNMMAMTFIAPLTWIATWPWLWTNTAERIIDHLRHFLVHQQTAVWFHGQRWGYGEVNAPMIYPLEMIAVTTPLWTLLLVVIGLAVCWRRRDDDGRFTLFALLALIPLAVASMPGTPRYDGARLFFPVLAPMALLAGLGVAAIRDRFRSPRWRLGAVAAMGVLLTLPSLWGILRIHPCELSFFNLAVGGIRGASDRGYEMTWWCEAVNEPVIAHLNSLPEGSTIRPLALQGMVFEHLQAWGVLDPDLQFVSPPQGATDYHILQNRRGFFGTTEAFLWDHWMPENTRHFGWPRGSETPVVSMVAVAETGPAFEQARIAHIQSLEEGNP